MDPVVEAEIEEKDVEEVAGQRVQHSAAAPFAIARVQRHHDISLVGPHRVAVHVHSVRVLFL